MPTIHLKGPGLNNWFAEQLVRDHGHEAAREGTCGPMREAVERVIEQQQRLTGTASAPEAGRGKEA